MIEPRSLGIRGQFLATLRAAHRFSGRSTRGEVVIYYLGCLFLSILLSALLFPLDFDAKSIANRAIQVALAIPAIALFTRRMHDQNRTGWWVLLPIALFTYSTALSLIAELQGPEARIAIERAMRQLDLAPFFGLIAVLALTFWPGTLGPNRFGHDPRREAD